MQIEALRTFAECASRGSFAAAARAMEVDPSAVSRTIATLEARLGVRLFERSTRTIALTEAGALYRARVAPLLDDLDDAAQAARDLSERPAGRLRVAASSAFGERVIVPMLGVFLADHPGLDVDLVLSDAPVDLLAERIDIAVRLTQEAPPDTIVSKLCATRYRVLAAPHLRLRPTRPEDLADIPVIRFALPGFRDLWRFRGDGFLREVPIAGRVEVTGAAAVLAAARAGLGPALLADWLAGDDLAAGRLVDLFPRHEVTATGFDTAAWLLTPSRRYQPLKTRVFVKALRAHVENRVIPGENSVSGN
ncbi:MAG: LysR family transcriptional regulator [Paracoccaceae bacterium]|nr:LysR family transcriptional regulator [Paracoccaceae bacterium]